MASTERNQTVIVPSSKKHLYSTIWRFSLGAFFFAFVFFIVYPVAKFRGLHPEGNLDILFAEIMGGSFRKWTYLCVAIFFACLAIWVYRYVRIEKPLVVIDKVGIVIHRPFSTFRLNWDQIRTVTYKKASLIDTGILNMGSLVIRIAPSLALSKQPLLQRIAILHGFGHLQIWQYEFNVPPGYVLEQMAKHLPNVQTWKEG